MNNLSKVFNYEGSELATTMKDSNPIFVAKDICDILDIKNVTQALQSLDEDEKLIYKIYRAGQERELNFVTEAGLYNLIFRSNKPEAKAFKRWVTHEVLPTIRKTGGYTLNPNDGIKLAGLISKTSMKKLPIVADILKQSGIVINIDFDRKDVPVKNDIPVVDILKEYIASDDAQIRDTHNYLYIPATHFKAWLISKKIDIPEFISSMKYKGLILKNKLNISTSTVKFRKQSTRCFTLVKSALH